MTAAVSRAVMSLAARCLGTDRREWGRAMAAEFEAAVEDGKPFAFAAGCLIAAWREMARHGEGRLVLANYALALGLLLPMAAFQFDRAIFVSSIVHAQQSHYGLLVLGAGQSPFVVWSQISAVPALLTLWLLLGIAHLGLAWVLVEGDWPRVVRFGAVIGAVTVTLLLFAGVLLLDLSSFVLQATGLGVELAAIVGAARWQARVHPNGATEALAR
jgi:hypothetical protein